jgi:CO/xanthine dehydrogenase FAD-binding subunit
MLNKYTTVYNASSVQEIQAQLKNIAGISLVAGCTEIARREPGRSMQLPANILSLLQIPEMSAITKTERYIEFGPCVTLAAILLLGRKNIPDVLYDAVRTIANPAVRTLATLGGNIAAKGRRLSAFAPLLALDSRLEIRTPLEAAWIPMSRYFSNNGAAEGRTGEFISKIRVPTESWDIAVNRRIGRPGVVTDTMAGFVFMAKFQKNILADIRIAYAGKYFFRKREFENLMIGRTLPLSEKDIVNLMDKANLFFDRTLFPPSYERKVLFNLLEESLRMLT